MLSLAEYCPELLDEWMYEKNDRNPQNLVPGTEYKAWWKCKKCKYEWKAMVASRTRNRTGCPVCAGRIVVGGINDFQYLYPEIAKEWDYDKNILKPTEVTIHSDKKVWWLCPICQHSYITAIKHRTRGSSCPKCSKECHTSFPEQAIYYYLKQEFNDTQNRYDLLGKEADIFVPCMNIAIEYDGSFYHNTNESLIREKNKYEHFKTNGIKLIRIREKNLVDRSFADYVIQLNKKCNDREIKNVIIKIFNIIYELYNYKISKDIDIKSDRQYIYSDYIKKVKANSVSVLYPNILEEWDYDKNFISPNSLLPGSEKKVWWKCLKGHSYEQQVASHIKGAGCPYCSGLYVLPGENDLESLYPNIAKEWDYNKNKLKPSEVKYGASLKAWWICPKGHSYQQIVHNRTGYKKSGCIYCSNKAILGGFNDLKSQKPELVKEWDYEKNERGPQEYVCGSQKKVWWKCSKGHSYEAIIYTRVKMGTGCPICNGKQILDGFNDLKSQYPKLMKEWNYEKNNKLEIYPNKIHVHSSKKVWWKCIKCKHEWKSLVESRTRLGSACPICALQRIGENRVVSLVKERGSLMNYNPEITKEWDYIKNEKGPENYTKSSNKKVWWVCSKGHSYKALISSRVNFGTGCPICNGKQILEGYNDFQTHYPELMDEWNYEKNSKIDIYPNKIHFHSHKKVWWKCNKCKYEWQQEVRKRAQSKIKSHKCYKN